MNGQPECGVQPAAASAVPPPRDWWNYAVQSFDHCTGEHPCAHCKAGRPEAPAGAEPTTGSGGVWEHDDEVRHALPPTFHRPEFLDTLSPAGWFCACCWDEGKLQRWPCRVASAHGGYLSRALKKEAQAR